MSKRICGRCKSEHVYEDVYYGGTQYYECQSCLCRGDKDNFPEMTLFHQITASPEVLAQYCIATKPGVDGKTLYYYSTVTSHIYLTENQALAATVAKFKEVVK